MYTVKYSILFVNNLTNTVKTPKKKREIPAILSINYDKHLNFVMLVLYYKGNDRVDRFVVSLLVINSKILGGNRKWQ